MKQIYFGIKILVAALVVLSLFSCNAEKKAVRYKAIYEERPAMLMVMNTIDKCQMKDITNTKTKKKNTIYNNEIKQANIYFHQGLFNPLAKLGYYVVQNFATNEILANENAQNSEKYLLDTLQSLSFLYGNYGIDAALFTTVFAWKETEEAWSVYLQYQLKSTITNKVICEIHVKGKTYVATTSYGRVQVQPQAKTLAKRLDVSNELGQRVLMLNQINNYVLSNLPVGKFAKDFDKDQNKAALANCIEYAIDETGGLTIQKIPMEKFEQECFLF